jgi:transcriptional antiterminator NusG
VNYYALQVKTRSEAKYIKLYEAVHPDVPIKLHFLLRKLNIRRRGHVTEDVRPIFPSYVFLEMEAEEDIIRYSWDFKHTNGFYRFLKSNQDIQPLSGKDLEIVLHFIRQAGPIAGLSKVYFDENARIVVMEGPLKGLEGKIVKVDKRKGRAKIKLDLYDDSFSIDLAFEMIANIPKNIPL